MLQTKKTKSCKSKAKDTSQDRLLLFSLPNAVLFPGNYIPIKALNLPPALIKRIDKGGMRVGVVTELSEHADRSYLADVGCEGEVTSLLRMPDGRVGAVVQGLRRFQLIASRKRGETCYGDVQYFDDANPRRTSKYLALERSLRRQIARLLVVLDDGVRSELRLQMEQGESASGLADLIVPHLTIDTSARLALLREPRVLLRLKEVVHAVRRELELLKLSDNIVTEVESQLDEDQRRGFLREQIRTLKRELGEIDGVEAEAERLEAELEEHELPTPVQQAAGEELERMVLAGVGSPEYFIAHNYINLLLALPWKPEAPKLPSLDAAVRRLDRGHYGIDQVKDKVLDYLAVLLRRKRPTGQILLLQGPPGVGKTSLAMAIAAALERPFASIALGGIKDEAEIRGHRRTYVGAMPGKIITAIKNCKSQTPVILLDEVDKVARDGQADVSSALLEVLDPIQNREFIDHHLGIAFDLSKVLFIATANDLDSIPPPLLDRMEIITLSSYSENEKLTIARRHILPQLRRELDLSAAQLKIDREALLRIVREYTNEAGVRQLQRELTTLARRLVRRLVERRGGRLPAISLKNVAQWLGPPRFLPDRIDGHHPPGVTLGLAYTDVGGEILYVEVRTSAARNAGEGRLQLTGSLGAVMQESAQAALTYLTVSSPQFGVSPQSIESLNFHVHFPDGATPKDGPSAGLAILMAMISAVTNRAVPSSVAFTGEITLRGQILAVGGVREKVLAALRYGRREVFLPQANASDLANLPEPTLKQVRIHLVDNITQVIDKFFPQPSKLTKLPRAATR